MARQNSRIHCSLGKLINGRRQTTVCLLTAIIISYVYRDDVFFFSYGPPFYGAFFFYRKACTFSLIKTIMTNDKIPMTNEIQSTNIKTVLVFGFCAYICHLCFVFVI
jgi:hypothetical protein